MVMCRTLLISLFLMGCASAPQSTSGGRMPRILHREMVQAAIEAEVQSLRGIGFWPKGDNRAFTVELMVRVYSDGSVGEIRIEKSSGQFEVDSAAARVARSFLRFAPAVTKDGLPVEVWASFPVTFSHRR
jgi:TonB family protein